MSEASEKMPGLRESAKIDYSPSPLEESLRRLERLTRSLRVLGLLAFLSTVGCIGLSFFAALNSSHSINFLGILVGTLQDKKNYGVAFVVSLFLGGLAFAIVVFHESLRRQGETLFEEISDELEWRVQETDHLGNQAIAEERPDLRARIALRSFTRTTDLPLVPGRFGPAIYAGLNILSILAELWITKNIF